MLIWTLAAVAGSAFLIDRAALMTMRPPRRSPERLAADLGYPITPIEVTTDRVTIRGDLLEPEQVDSAAPVVVLVHGWTGDSSTMLHLAEPLLAAGLPVAVFDVRSHGRSDPAPAVTVTDVDPMVRSETIRALSTWALQPGTDAAAAYVLLEVGLQHELDPKLQRKWLFALGSAF